MSRSADLEKAWTCQFITVDHRWVEERSRLLCRILLLQHLDFLIKTVTDVSKALETEWYSALTIRRSREGNRMRNKVDSDQGPMVEGIQTCIITDYVLWSAIHREYRRKALHLSKPDRSIISNLTDEMCIFLQILTSVPRVFRTFVPSSALMFLAATSAPVLHMDILCLPMDTPAEVSLQGTYTMSPLEQSILLFP